MRIFGSSTTRAYIGAQRSKTEKARALRQEKGREQRAGFIARMWAKEQAAQERNKAEVKVRVSEERKARAPKAQPAKEGLVSRARKLVSRIVGKG
jgi:hypothetical protein